MVEGVSLVPFQPQRRTDEGGRRLGGGAARMSQLFARSQSRSTNVATFLALLELVRGGRVTLGPKGELAMQRGRLPREKAKEEE